MITALPLVDDAVQYLSDKALTEYVYVPCVEGVAGLNVPVEFEILLYVWFPSEYENV